MLEFMGVAVLSAAGWLISLGCPRSAARRHVVLCATLASCLLLPAVLNLRAATGWTWLAIPDSRATGGMNDNLRPKPTRAIDPPTPGRTALPPLRPDDAAGSSVNALDPVPGGNAIGNDEPSLASTSAASAGNIAGRNDAASSKQIARGFNRISRTGWATAEPLGTCGARSRGWCAVSSRRCQSHCGRAIEASRHRGRYVCRRHSGGGSGCRHPAGPRVRAASDRPAPGISRLHQFRRAAGRADPRSGAPAGSGDHWVMLLQSLLAAAYWPIVTIYLVNRALTRAREELCDNAVLAGRDPASYGRTLLTVADACRRDRKAFSARGWRRFGHWTWKTGVSRGGTARRAACDRRTQVGRPVRRSVTLGLLVAAALAVTTRVVAVADEPKQQPTPPASDKATAAQPGAIQWTGIPKVDRDNPIVHRGVVLRTGRQAAVGRCCGLCREHDRVAGARPDRQGRCPEPRSRAGGDRRGRTIRVQRRGSDGSHAGRSSHSLGDAARGHQRGDRDRVAKNLR